MTFHTADIVIFTVILTILLCIIVRLNYKLSEMKEEAKNLTNELEDTNKLYIAEQTTSVRRLETIKNFFEGEKVLKVIDISSRDMVCVVAELTSNHWAQCVIKTIPYDPYDPEDHAFALREANELIDTIRKW